MPKKLERCIDKVKDQGKSEDSAYAICSDSTGIKKKKGGGWTKGKDTVKENRISFNSRFEEVMGYLEEKAPSAGLSKKKKSEIVSKAKKGKDIGKKGKEFKKIEKSAEKKYGSKEAGERVAGAAMWKNANR